MNRVRVGGLVAMLVFGSLSLYFLQVRPDIWWTIYPITHRPLPYVGSAFFGWLGVIGLVCLIKGE